MRHEADQDRTETLYRTFGPVIYARCRHLLRDDAAAEDATHETFLRVQRHLARAPEEALAWIYRVATNYCLNELRNHQRRAELRGTMPVTSAYDVEQALLDRDLAVRIIVRAAPKLALVAWLHHVDGMEQEELARVLGISRRTVINRLRHFHNNARKFIRRSSE